MLGATWIRLAVFVSVIAEVEPLAIDRQAPALHGHRARPLTGGDARGEEESCAALINKESHFTVSTGFGTPPQQFEIVADTGSDEVIVKSCICGNFSHECAAEPDCFQGTNRSSTFVPPVGGWQDSLLVRRFGSGDIITAPATDVVLVGRVQARMRQGIMLMIDRKLMFPGPFEGILGLGLPSWANPGASSERTSNATRPELHFLEAAGVDRFSICFNDNGQPGALRFQPEAPQTMLKHMGLYHWGLDLQGMSVGSAKESVAFCDPSSKAPGQETACGAIPDSGTTLMMGPQEHIDTLFTDICQRWPRCRKVADSAPSARDSGAIVFKHLLEECEKWLTDDEGLSEVPSIFLHLAGGDGEKQTLELTSWAYITKTQSSGRQVCEPLFGEFQYHTGMNGPVWIFGTPLFFEFQVTFGMQPASIGFSNRTCGSCGQDAPSFPGRSPSNLVAASGVGRPDRRVPREMNRPPRMPRLDVTQPL